MRIEIRYIEKEQWHGKKGQQLDFLNDRVIRATVNTRTGKYDVALSDKELEEYGLDVKFNRDVPHVFWDDKAGTVNLEHNTFFLNTDKRVDHIKYAIMLKSRFVANNMVEYNAGKWPDANWVIYSEEKEIAAKAAVIDVLTEARSLSFEMSGNDKVVILLLLNKKNYSKASDKYLSVHIEELIVRDPKEFLRVCKMDREDRNVRAVLQECLLRGVIKEENAALHFGEQRIAFTFEDAVEYVSKPEHSEFLQMLRRSLKVETVAEV